MPACQLLCWQEEPISGRRYKAGGAGRGGGLKVILRNTFMIDDGFWVFSTLQMMQTKQGYDLGLTLDNKGKVNQGGLNASPVCRKPGFLNFQQHPWPLSIRC